MSTPPANGHEEEKDVGVYDKDNYHYLNHILENLEKKAEVKVTSEKLEDRVKLMTAWRDPKNPLRDVIKAELMEHFVTGVEGSSSVYKAARDVLYKKLDDDEKKFKEGKDVDEIWEVVDAFVENALKKMYNIKDEDWADFKKKVANTELSTADKNNEKALKERLRVLYNESIGNPEQGDSVYARFEYLYELLGDKTRAQAVQVLTQASQLAHQAHFNYVEGKLKDKLLGPMKNQLMAYVRDLAAKQEYDSKLPWAQRNLDNLTESLYLYNKDLGTAVVGKTHEELGYKKLTPKKEEHAH